MSYSILVLASLDVTSFPLLCSLSSFMWIWTMRTLGNQLQKCFGVTGDAPRVIGFKGNENGKKFVLDGELTLSSIKVGYSPFYKSDPGTEKPFMSSCKIFLLML